MGDPGTIVFGVCVASDERFERYALPGIRRCAGEDATVITRRNQDSIFTAYNSILDEASKLEDLQALVLLHDDTEICDPSFLQVLAGVFANDFVGIVGVAGARGVRSLAWWEGERYGRVTVDQGSGRIDHVRGQRVTAPTQVDSVDGLLMALSPWTVRTIRFDEERFHGFHGYDADLCFAVRARGKSVVVADVNIHHHHDVSRPFVARLAFRRNNIQWKAKWGLITPRSIPWRLVTLRLESLIASLRTRVPLKRRDEPHGTA